MAYVATKQILSTTDLRGLRIQFPADVTAAIFVLLIIIVLLIYKPLGKTDYGRKNGLQYEAAPVAIKKKASKKYLILALIALLLLFIIMYLASGGMHH